MTCQEVMEYMQRSLDQDLSEPEYEKMQEHLLGCASCSSVYERLQLISVELEKLPKVAPKSSLVDEILPKLEEIDRINASGGDIDILLPSRSDSSAAAADPIALKRRINNFMSWKIAGGIAAAGILLVLFLFNQSPISIQNAEGYLRNSADEKSGAISDSSAAADNTAKVAKSAKSEPHAESSSQEAAGTENRIMGTESSAGQDAKFMGMEKAEPSVKRSISVSSPDQTMTANVIEEDGSIQVAIQDKDGTDVYVSRMYPGGQVRNVKWSDDGKQLNFDLLSGESVEHVHLDVERKTETEN